MRNFLLALMAFNSLASLTAFYQFWNYDHSSEFMQTCMLFVAGVCMVLAVWIGVTLFKQDPSR